MPVCISTKGKKDKSLSCCSFNVNSLVSEERQLGIFNIVLEKDLDFMCLVETKLDNSSVPISSSTPNGYSNFHVERKGGKKGGGVAIIYKTIYTCQRLKIHSEIITNTFEYIAIKVTPANRASFTLVAIYRPPSSNANIFVDQFINLYNYIVDEFHDNVVLVGDMNIHVNKPEESVARKFLDSLHDFSLQNHIKTPTFSNARVSSNESNTLDLIIDSSFHNIVHSTRVSFEFSFSDHAMVFFNLDIEKVKLIKFNKVIPVFPIIMKIWKNLMIIYLKTLPRF